MSAPHLVDPPAMPTMVSRLPKFGSRPRSQTAPAATAAVSTSAAAAAAASAGTRLTNGFYHHPGPSGGNGALTAPPSSAKQNGFIRVPSSISVKLRRENGLMVDGGGDGERAWSRGKGGWNRSSVQQFYSQRDAKKAASVEKGRGFGLPVPSSSSPSPQSSPSTPPASKIRSNKLSPSGPTNGAKHALNGVSGPKPRPGPSSSLRRPQSFLSRAGGSGPGSRAGSPFQKKTPANRSYSSDSLGSAVSVRLTEDDRFRSRSLTQVRRQPSPTLTPSSASSSSLPQSPSTSRAPPKGSLLKPPSARSGVPSLLPPSALKKPLLPSLSPTSRPSGISYKMSRPTLIKQSRPLRATTANQCVDDQGLSRRKDSVETPSTTENSPENTPEAPDAEELLAEPASQAEVSILGETLEDMSLSSTSSLDRNDTSQEYMDDFDNLGNGGVGILLLSSKNEEDDSGLDQSCARFDDDKVVANCVTKATGLCFLDDGIDWSSVRLTGERGDHQLTQLSRRRRSSQPDYHEQGGSSLDLSPSDSCGSGGTYMWDEEGLEPLGGVATTASIHTSSNTTHHIGSFDSDLNSIDILNNLDSCDLADDDLMLDADFPEDGSLHSDGDGLSHMAQWRKRQLCWGTQDVHNDNEGLSNFQSYKLTEDPGNKRTDSNRDGELVLDLCPPSSSTSPSPGTPSLGLDVEELAEDCSAVRCQLEYLQRLLLQEDDGDDDTLTTDTLSPEANDSLCSSDSQIQALLQEVQQLREELRSRDRTIAQLTQQLTVPMVTTRCRCQEMRAKTDQQTQTSVTERESTGWTLWRERTPQILHSSNQEDQEPLTGQVPTPPRTQAPPSTNICPAHPETPADRLRNPRAPSSTHPAAHVGEDDGEKQRKVEETKSGERKKTHSRYLQPPQPSKLRLFPKTRAARDPDTNSTSGLNFRTLAFTSTSSRLPKPKNH
ncbi:serine-rich coiled-coil domain-containing protein 2-like isoform X1 [Astatotilapia calliptera]|uniref:Coiled-coil serine-rich protein 2a n=1 Tax=Astatotilapia calliptera TaxID=8154 RepID=A0A3P8QFE4_ASTCA|nr:serine-rich coiled-coil domain-containing protein 2-like isoform X1 [Astatotilapia calliptera]XP_026033608.1 serine-rich coiled-coil domain-containing protein 2-like isoform X1 [Astatotilapia calliptera]